MWLALRIAAWSPLTRRIATQHLQIVIFVVLPFRFSILFWKHKMYRISLVFKKLIWCIPSGWLAGLGFSQYLISITFYNKKTKCWHFVCFSKLVKHFVCSGTTDLVHSVWLVWACSHYFVSTIFYKKLMARISSGRVLAGRAYLGDVLTHLCNLLCLRIDPGSAARP